MAEPNNSKRMHSPENTTGDENANNKHIRNSSQNNKFEINSASDKTISTFQSIGDNSLISKPAVQSLLRNLPRNVVGTISKKTSTLARRTLRSTRSSLKTLNQGWDTFNSLSSTHDNSRNTYRDAQKEIQTLIGHKNYTFRLRKIKEKFKTRRQIRKDRCGSLQTVSHDRFRKDLNQSKIENNRQAKLLEKLLEEHNKHLESL